MMNRAIVTGGAGFIGSHLVDWLVGMDIEVLVLDNLSTGIEKNVNPSTQLCKVDLSNEWETRQVVGLFDPDVVFHLAAQANVPRSAGAPKHDAMSNIIGSIHLFEACKSAGIDKLIYASTGGGIYAGVHDDEEGGCSERAPEKPKCPYGVSKLSVEIYLRSFYYQYFKHTTLRLPNVYGTRRNPDSGAGVVSIFSRNIIEGKPCYMYGGGELGRDYVHVSDVVMAFWIAATHRVGTLYNIGSGKPVAVKEIAKHVADYATEKGYTPEFIEAQIREGEALLIQIDSSKFRQRTGWEPTVELSSGIRSTFDWVEEQYEHDSS